MTVAAKQPEIIHISWAGPEYWMSIGTRKIRFEDHRYCGPIVLNNKTGEPLEEQPDERSVFWLHYEAWARQGKKTMAPCQAGGKVWCVYETELQSWRRRLSAAKDTQSKEAA